MSSTEPRSGLKYAWSAIDENFSAELDSNIKRIGRAFPNYSVKDRDLTAPPGSPVAGDQYIPKATATGAWASHETHIATWNGASWEFEIPKTGWLTYVEDEQVLSVFKSGAWSAGVAI